MNNQHISIGEETAAFYFHFTACINCWSVVESRLTYAVCCCFHENERNQIFSGMIAIENFRSRLEFSSNLIEQKLSGNEVAIAHWNKIKSLLTKGARKRNTIAHGNIATLHSNPIGKRLVVAPWHFNNASTESESEKYLNSFVYLKDLILYMDCFSQICELLLEFSGVLLGRRAQLPESLELPNHRQEKHVIGAISLIRAMLGLPTQPSASSPDSSEVLP